ncbi:unnamed protein product [Rodentolepis nana]|uniref:Ig-like domain-containing protein n=1 Tax=Rodentolepis nana TaxID=102285 RepID=A0A0R3TV10_RODNA|nr:unnamed protein product [Rodentolepis nana]
MPVHNSIMIRHAQLLVFTCLACLTHQAASQFAYDGPYYHEVLAGGLVDLPCYLSTHAKRIALKSFNSPIRRSDTLRWVHRRFDNMVDPWTGDGRRSYLKVGILQANDPLVEEMGLLHIPMVSGVGLRIVAVNPSVAGLYACILSTQPFDSGLHLIGENDTLLSIHSLRVKEVDRLTSEEISRRKVKRISVQRTQFEEWTWVVNPSKNILSDGTVFKIDCYADIALTGLVLRRVSGKVVRIGWKFIPRENNTYIDVVNASKDGSEWDLVSPEEFFHSEEDEMEWLRTVSVDEDDEEGDQQGANEDEIAEGDFDILESWTLRTAFLEATMRRWKSRWLRLDRELALRGSGLWQCWLEGIDLYEPKSTKSVSYFQRSLMLL